MKYQTQPPALLVSALAMLQWAYILRPFGKVGRFGVDTERRAAEWLECLKAPNLSLKFCMKVRQLEYEPDLLLDEHALNSSCLELQVRIFDLADQFPVLGKLVDKHYGKSPIARLMGAVIAQAHADKSEAISIDLTPQEPDLGSTEADQRFKIRFQNSGQWKEAMAVPANLGVHLLGCSLRMQAIGYERAKPFMVGAERLPAHVEIEVDRPNNILITILPE